MDPFLKYKKLENFLKVFSEILEAISINFLTYILHLETFFSIFQTCRMTFGSWSFDNSLIDYFPRTFTNGPIGLANFLENDAWSVLGTKGEILMPTFKAAFAYLVPKARHVGIR